jgi:hypothetical protein
LDRSLPMMPPQPLIGSIMITSPGLPRLLQSPTAQRNQDFTPNMMLQDMQSADTSLPARRASPCVSP